jgi:hypothetical protein
VEEMSDRLSGLSLVICSGTKNALPHFNALITGMFHFLGRSA